MSSEHQASLHELEILEHNLQHLSMQKQTIQLELNETINALNEIEKTNDEVYRVLGNIMLRADKSLLRKELEEKKRVLALRLEACEKQEALLEKKAQDLSRKSTQISQSKNESHNA